MNITFTIPDAVAPRVLDAMAVVHGYQAQIDDPADPANLIPNPETKAQFAKRKIREFMLQAVRMNETNIAVQQAQQQVADAVNAEIVIT